MENFFSNSIKSYTSNNGGSSGGQSSNLYPAWNFWQLGTTNSSSFTQNLTVGQTFNSTCPLNSFEAERRLNEGATSEHYFHGERGGIQYPTDHHLMCLNLNLGKRHYSDDLAQVASGREGNQRRPITEGESEEFWQRMQLKEYSTMEHLKKTPAQISIENNYEPQGVEQVVGFVMNNNKRGRQYMPGDDEGLVGPSKSTTCSPVAAAGAAALVPRCQMEGCHAALVNAKAYHRRHKVCEMHAKAPKAVVLGLVQRFCQQCSRFHSVCEFDESKRSCRRRLAGHNERRRKSSQDHYANTRNPSQGNYRHLAVNDGSALSLLSSKNNESWISKGNLPARCSGTISELIAESRAATLAQQLILGNHWHQNQHHLMENLSIQPKNLNSAHNRDHMFLETHGWGPLNDAAGNLTLNLMHIRNSEFRLLSQPKEERQEEEGCQERWNSFAGAHIS